MSLISNVVSWFEVPVSDMDRAIKFYEKIFDYKLQFVDLGELKMALFPTSKSGVGASGSLIQHPTFYKPSNNGTLVYFSSPSGDLQNELDKIEKAGCEVIIPKRQISESGGFMGLFLDSEGNRVALHSFK